MAKFLNNILCTFMIFILAFAWSLYCLHDGLLALAIAFIIALCSCYVIFEVLNKVDAIQNKNKHKKNILRSFEEYLHYNADNEKTFRPMFEFFGYDVERVDYDNAVICREKRIFATICFSTASISPDALRQAIVSAKRQNCQSLFIFCNKAENPLQTSANRQIETKFIDLQNTLALFDQADKIPELTTTKKQAGAFCRNIFNRKCFRWYLSGAIFTLFTAFFSLLKFYLLTWSTALLSLALYSLYNKKYNIRPTNIKLE